MLLPDLLAFLDEAFPGEKNVSLKIAINGGEKLLTIQDLVISDYDELVLVVEDEDTE